MKYAIAIHGGAGTILKSQMTPEKEANYLQALKDSIRKGYQILQSNGSAVDAVEAAVKSMEDSPLFNAGKGSVFSADGKHEMDAAIMDGKNLDAGAVSSISSVRNPIELAKIIMQKSEHVFLSGTGAEIFAQQHNIQFEKESYFFDQLRYDQWEEIKDSDSFQLDHSLNKDRKFGTVGAVALDSSGNIAAATSTGGMTNKKYGRIGDSPIIGAGTYADNAVCAVSCTGSGEYFIRAVTAYDLACLMKYKNLKLKEAAETVIHNHLLKIGGDGGLIAIDNQGNISMPFNTEGMYRARISTQGEEIVNIYK
jgi:beta-aspartyl-peptidase (threonine type)